MCAAAVLLPALAAAQAAPTLVGILEGSATLIRQTTRYAVAEGLVLNEQDILETAKGSFLQIELPDGVLIGVGESTRLMLRPRVAKGLPATPLYLLEGWLKTSANGAYAYVSPSFELATQGATSVVYTSGEPYEVFIENGTAKLTLRDASRAVSQLGAGDFAQRRAGVTPTLARRAAPEFIVRVPRQFRDRLPARAAQLAKRTVTPKSLGEIDYADVAPWLRTESALRQQFLPLWRARCKDNDFRAAAKAGLAQHPEWEPYADPEGYARKKAEEAERRRAREAAREAARAAASAAESR